MNTGISFESQVAHGDLFLSCFLLIATLEGTEQQEEKIPFPRISFWSWCHLGDMTVTETYGNCDNEIEDIPAVLPE